MSEIRNGMMEKTIAIERADMAILMGVNRAHISTIRDLYPQLKIAARGNQIHVQGNEKDVEEMERTVERIVAHIEQYNTIDEQTIALIANNRQDEVVRDDVRHTVVHGASGRAIVARSGGQRKMEEIFEENDLMLVEGPAGSGKTYMAVALAVKALKEKRVRRIVLSRPAVEAGEKLGFLPGDMREKISPYLQPLYDALEDMLPHARLSEYMERGIVQIAPLAFMRGRTLGDAVVVLDEAQNATVAQMRMFLTRLGLGAKMIVTGDLTQVDLPASQLSGMRHAIGILRDVKGVGIVEMKPSDIVRHRLVERIVAAYSRQNEADKKNEKTELK